MSIALADFGGVLLRTVIVHIVPFGDRVPRAVRKKSQPNFRQSVWPFFPLILIMRLEAHRTSRKPNCRRGLVMLFAPCRERMRTEDQMKAKHLSVMAGEHRKVRGR